MKRIHTLSLAMLMGLSSLALATEPTAPIQKPEQAVAETSCRNVTDLQGTVHSYCGTAAKWAEFDKQMAKLDKGFSCKSIKESPQQLCLFAKQWEYVNRTNVLARGGELNNFGSGQQDSAMAINHNDANVVRQGLLDASNGMAPLP